jgi:hypothetical protein
MRYLLTVCSNDKDQRVGLLPARGRYKSEFMQRVIALGEQTNTPVLILSGELGILEPDDEIPYYDHALTENEVESMVGVVAERLEELEATELLAYIKESPDVRGWGPYYNLIELAAYQTKINLEYAKLEEPSEPRSETYRLH